jgi:GNAT superfamily N-acetyltransferase
MAQIPVVIRKAVESDCPRLMELVNELAVFERAPDDVTVSLQHFIDSGFGSNPVWWALVAEVDDQIIGFALYYIRYSTWQGQKMYLEDIIITEEWRRKGIGTLLMDKLIEEAREKRFKGVSWQVLHWNESAMKFYERLNPRFDNEWVNVMLNFNDSD